MGVEQIAVPILLAAGTIAAAMVASHEHWRRKQARDRGDQLLLELRPARLYRIRARVEETAAEPWHRVELEALFAELEIDHDPPRAGPEIELRFTQIATSRQAAERFATRRLGRLGMPPIVLAADDHR